MWRRWTFQLCNCTHDITQYEPFQQVKDQLKKEGFHIGLETAN